MLRIERQHWKGWIRGSLEPAQAALLSAADQLMNLVCPPECVWCDARLPPGMLFCGDCRSKLVSDFAALSSLRDAHSECGWRARLLPLPEFRLEILSGYHLRPVSRTASRSHNPDQETQFRIAKNGARRSFGRVDSG